MALGAARRRRSRRRGRGDGRAAAGAREPGAARARRRRPGAAVRRRRRRSRGELGAGRPRSARPRSTRRPVAAPLATGVRVLDGLLTLGEGQRIGLFAGSGVGKSTLLGAMRAGRRGRRRRRRARRRAWPRGGRVPRALARAPQGRKKSVVVVATSDVAALERLRAAQVATAYAEHFRDAGSARAPARRLGHALRPRPARGRPRRRRASRASRLSAERLRHAPAPARARRAGRRAAASPPSTPCSSRAATWTSPSPTRCAASSTATSCSTAPSPRAGAIRRSTSPSRSRASWTRSSPAEHRDAARRLRALVATYEAKRDLVTLGAYAKGSDRELDEAIARMPRIEAFLRAGRARERSPLDDHRRRA